MIMNVMDEVLKNKDYLIRMRRHFHQNPELGWKEYQTAETIRNELTSFHIPFSTVGDTGTVAVLKGKQNQPIIGLRCDIDALPITEVKEKSYKSKINGQMHACGHDSHIAMLLTAAKVLSEHRDELNCTVKFIFQPAEEVATGEKSGAKDILASGLVEDLSTVCGMHILPTIDSGMISVDEGPRFTSAAILKIRIIGKAGHGAMPHFSIDPIYVACKVVDALQSIVSRETNPSETVVISICSFHCGKASNVIDKVAYLEGTIRTFNPELREKIPQMIERIVANTCAAYRAQYELEIDNNYPVTINDARCSKLAEKSVVQILGEKSLAKYPKTPGGEDFAYFLQRYPGVYAFTGCRNPEKDCVYSLHHNMFDLDEDAMQNGAAFYIQYTLDAQEAFK
jgi:amidohydrolase